MRLFKTGVISILLVLIASFAFAGTEVDTLTKKLVEKKILTQQEAEGILVETKEAVKKDLEKGKLDTLPKWAQTTKFSGDLRLRYENRDRVILNEQNFANLRFRYGFEANANENIKAGARLASGTTSNQTSREQNLRDAFNAKSIWLDLAYLEYSPFKKLKLIAGKMKNPFYLTHDMVWDGDVTPEGGALQFKYTIILTNRERKYVSDIDYFVNLAALPLDGDNNISPVIYAVQAGVSPTIFGRKPKGTVSYYTADGIKSATYTGITPNYSKQTNTLAGGKFIYDYDILDTGLEYPILDINLFGKKMPINLSGSYVKNVAKEVKKDEAWLAGVKFGEAKDPNNWDFSYNYRRIAADSTLDFLNDAAFHGGGTNAKGHKFSLRYIPAKNTDLTISCFSTEKVVGLKSSGEVRDTLQVDFTTKF